MVLSEGPHAMHMLLPITHFYGRMGKVEQAWNTSIDWDHVHPGHIAHMLWGQIWREPQKTMPFSGLRMLLHESNRPCMCSQAFHMFCGCMGKNV